LFVSAQTTAKTFAGKLLALELSVALGRGSWVMGSQDPPRDASSGHCSLRFTGMAPTHGG
jgi:hypothetical protein